MYPNPGVGKRSLRIGINDGKCRKCDLISIENEQKYNNKISVFEAPWYLGLFWKKEIKYSFNTYYLKALIFQDIIIIIIISFWLFSFQQQSKRCRGSCPSQLNAVESCFWENVGSTLKQRGGTNGWSQDVQHETIFKQSLSCKSTSLTN